MLCLLLPWLCCCLRTFPAFSCAPTHKQGLILTCIASDACVSGSCPCSKTRSVAWAAQQAEEGWQQGSRGAGLLAACQHCCPHAYGFPDRALPNHKVRYKSHPLPRYLLCKFCFINAVHNVSFPKVCIPHVSLCPNQPEQLSKQMQLLWTTAALPFRVLDSQSLLEASIRDRCRVRRCPLTPAGPHPLC